MPGYVQTLASGVTDAAGVPATARISPNTRVSASTGTLGTVADLLQFPGAVAPFTVTGNWVSPNTRTLINALASISQSALGACVNAAGAPTGPMRVLVADPRVSAQ
jgi:hypothetical protein